MEWRTPQDNDTRTRTVFLLLPLTYHGRARWMEWAMICEVYSGYAAMWVMDGWADGSAIEAEGE